MTNLIGDEIDSYEEWLTVPGTTVHLYGKARPDRAENGTYHRASERGVPRPLGSAPEAALRAAAGSIW